MTKNKLHIFTVLVIAVAGCTAPPRNMMEPARPNVTTQSADFCDEAAPSVTLQEATVFDAKLQFVCGVYGLTMRYHGHIGQRLWGGTDMLSSYNWWIIYSKLRDNDGDPIQVLSLKLYHEAHGQNAVPVTVGRYRMVVVVETRLTPDLDVPLPGSKISARELLRSLGGFKTVDEALGADAP